MTNESAVDIMRQRAAQQAAERASVEIPTNEDRVREFQQTLPQVIADIRERNFVDCRLGTWNGTTYAIFDYRYSDDEGDTAGLPLLLLFNDQVEGLPVLNPDTNYWETDHKGGEIVTPENLAIAADGTKSRSLLAFDLGLAMGRLISAAKAENTTQPVHDTFTDYTIHGITGVIRAERDQRLKAQTVR